MGTPPRRSGAWTMMPTIEAGAHFSGSAGVWVRTEECKGFNAPMRALSVWVDEKNAWFVADENVRRVEQLLLDHFPEYMHVGGKKDGFIVNRLGVVSRAGKTAVMDAAARDSLRQLVEAALPVAREQAQLQADLRHALETGDERAALAIARRLCGLPALRVAS